MTFEIDQKVMVSATDEQFQNISLLGKVTNGAVGMVIATCHYNDHTPWRVRFNDDWWEFRDDMLISVPDDTAITDCKIPGFAIGDKVKIINASEALSLHVDIGAVGEIIHICNAEESTDGHIKVRFKNDWWWFEPRNLLPQPKDVELTDDKTKNFLRFTSVINTEQLNIGDRVMFVGNETDLEDVDISDYENVLFGSIGTVIDHGTYFGGTAKVQFNSTHWWLKPNRLIKVSPQTATTDSHSSAILREPRRQLNDGDAVMFIGTKYDVTSMCVSSRMISGAVGTVNIEDKHSNPEYPLVSFADISFYIRAEHLYRTTRSKTNVDGTDPNIVDLKTTQTNSVYADVTHATFTPTNEVFTMLTLKTIYTLNGVNIEELSVEGINLRIQNEEAEIEAMKKGKAKTKAYQREVAKREANLAEIIAFFDSRDDADNASAAE